MLVHTAVPVKWRDDLEIDESEPTEYNLVCHSSKSSRARKSLSLIETPELRKNLIESPKAQKRKALDVENVLFDDGTAESYIIDPEPEVSEEVEYIEEELPMPQIKENIEKPMYVVVKSNKSESVVIQPPSKKIMNYLKPAVTQKEGATFFLTKEGNITSWSNEEEAVKAETKSPEKKAQPKAKLPSPAPAQLENYTEFIFSGEM